MSEHNDAQNENQEKQQARESLFQTKGFRMVLVLVSIILVATFALEAAYLSTKDIIEHNQATKIHKGVLGVLGMDNSEEGLNARFSQRVEVRGFTLPDGKNFNVWMGKDDAGNLSGYVVRLTGGGFQGVVDIVVGLTSDLAETTGMEVINSGETPGLGDNMKQPDFRAQFNGMATEPQVDFVKYRRPTPSEPNKFQAITGASFTSTAIRNLLNAALVIVRSLKENGELELAQS